MDHTVNPYSSVLPSPLIFIMLGTMEYGIFQTIDTVQEIVYLCKNYILPSFSSLPYPPTQDFLFCFVGWNVYPFFFMLRYFNINLIRYFPPLPKSVIPHSCRAGVYDDSQPLPPPVLWTLNSLSYAFSLKFSPLKRRCFGYKYLQRLNKIPRG